MGTPTFELSAAATLGSFLGTVPTPSHFIPFPPLEQWSTNNPVFLDTNVLLGYYQMPLVARPIFYQWLLDIQGYVPDQVQREFRRHAKPLQQVHRRHLKNPVAVEQLEQSAIALQTYLHEQAGLLQAYPSWHQALEETLSEAHQLIKLSQLYNQEYLQQGHFILRQANKHNLVKVLHTLAPLKKKEFKQLKKEFNQAAAHALQENNTGFDDAVAAYQYRNPHHVFPGLGDVLHKRQNPYGDYLIYHEILKWAAQNKGEEPILFLTDDSTKGDWLNARGEAYEHYQQHFLEQTGRILHIHAARPLLEQWLNINTTTLLLPKEAQEDVKEAIWHQNAATMQPFSIKLVKTLLNKLWPERPEGGEDWEWQETIEYLQEESSCQSLFQLEGQLLQSYPQLIQQTLHQQQDYSQLEGLKKAISMPY